MNYFALSDLFADDLFAFKSIHKYIVKKRERDD